MRVRARVAFVLAAAACAACGALLGFEPIDYADDGGTTDAAPDVVTDAQDAAVLPDVVADADADVSVTCAERHAGEYDGGAILFCDDFERTTPVEQGWNGRFERAGGLLELSEEASTNGTRALLVTIAAGSSTMTKRAYLQTPDVPNGTEIVALEMDFRIDIGPPPGPSYPSNAFTIGSNVNVGGGFKTAYVRHTSAGAFDPIFFVIDGPSTFALGAWHHLTWRVEYGNQWIEITSKGDGGASVIRTTSQPQRPRYFWLGAEVDPSLGPVRMFVDDVVVHR